MLKRKGSLDPRFLTLKTRREIFGKQIFIDFEERDIPSWTGMVVTMSKYGGLITETTVGLCLAPRIQGKFS